MRIVLDTNVLVSGILYSGPPSRIIEAWRHGEIRLVLTPEILREYHATCSALEEQFPNVSLSPIIELIVVHSDLVQAPPLPTPACDDPDDDKFLACALAGGTRLIVSGDKHLLRLSGYRGIAVVRPRDFVARHLRTEA